MPDQSSTVCFACGQAVGFPPRINHRADGAVCQPCADRALENVPAALPKYVELAEEAEEYVEEVLESESATRHPYDPGLEDDPDQPA